VHTNSFRDPTGYRWEPLVTQAQTKPCRKESRRYLWGCRLDDVGGLVVAQKVVVDKGPWLPRDDLHPVVHNVCMHVYVYVCVCACVQFRLLPCSRCVA